VSRPRPVLPAPQHCLAVAQPLTASSASLGSWPPKRVASVYGASGRASSQLSVARPSVGVAGRVPLDVLAERRGTTRGALSKTIHDARRKLRVHLVEAGLLAGEEVRRP
jgi:hypothetical protein